jgi:hypothetical protein
MPPGRWRRGGGRRSAGAGHRMGRPGFWMRCSWAWATSCCSATPGCELPPSSSSSPIAAPGFMALRRACCSTKPTWPPPALVQPASRVNYRLAVAADRADAERVVADYVAWARRASSRAAARHARRVAAERPARDAADAGPRRQVPEPGGAAGGAAGRGGGGHRGARLRPAPPGRLRHAARARPAAAAHRLAYTLEFALRRPAGQRRRRAGWAWPCTTSSSGCCRACWARAAAARPLAGAVRAGRGHDAAAGPSACRRCCSWRACRRCGSCGAMSATSRPGRWRCCWPARRVSPRCCWRVVGRRGAGPDRRRRVCRRHRGVRLLAWGAVRLLQRWCPRRAHRAGWCWPRASWGPAGLRGAAGVGAGGRPAGPGAAGAAAHRPDRQLAAATPPDAPNRFVINIQPDQGEAFRQRLAEAGVTRYDWYPMIRGRLVAINGQAVRPTSLRTTARSAWSTASST